MMVSRFFVNDFKLEGFAHKGITFNLTLDCESHDLESFLCDGEIESMTLESAYKGDSRLPDPIAYALYVKLEESLYTAIYNDSKVMERLFQFASDFGEYDGVDIEPAW